MTPWEKASAATTFAGPAVPQPFAVANPQAIRGQIRGALNREFGFTKSNALGASTVEKEREQLIEVIHSLYQITADTGLLPVLNHADIIEASACLQRLQLLGHKDHKEIINFCKRKSQDGEKSLNFGDPLQRRHLHCFTSNLASNDFLMSQLTTLEEILHEDNSIKMDEWFYTLSTKVDQLPKDTPAFLRRYLLTFAESGKSCISSFAHQLAVLDVRMLGPIGWENTRGFFSLLKKLGGAKCEFLNNYLTHDELRDAISYHQNTGNHAAIEHFEFLYTSFSPHLLEAAKESVFTTSSKKPEKPRSPDNKTPTAASSQPKTAKSWLRLSSWLRASA